MKDFEQFKGCIQKQGLPELIIYDYSFTQQLEHAASINAELRQVPAVVIFGGDHNRLPETQLNRIYTVDVTQQSAQDIHAMIERFQNMLASTPASADKTRLINNTRMAGNQPQV